MLILLIFGTTFIDIGNLIDIGNGNHDKVNIETGARKFDLKYIVIGDPQINITTLDGVERLQQVVNFVNKSDIDFAVFLGDMTSDGTNKSNDVVIDILKGLKKPYYVVIGNHDIFVSPKVFESYYGESEHIENIKGYQLLFIGIENIKNEEGYVTKLNWSFDFSKADKTAPTLVFIHGPVKSIPTGCLYCRLDRDILSYGFSISPELDNFTNLIGVYSGHVHYDSDRTVNDIRYVTVNGLVNLSIYEIPIAHPSDKVGYSTIKDNKLTYELINYN